MFSILGTNRKGLSFTLPPKRFDEFCEIWVDYEITSGNVTHERLALLTAPIVELTKPVMFRERVKDVVLVENQTVIDCE